MIKKFKSLFISQSFYKYDPMLSQIRQDKKRLFGLIGFGSGAVGALIANMFAENHSNIFFISIIFISIIMVALWAAISAAVISIGLYFAIDVYSHRQTDWLKLLKNAVPWGILAGLISGGVAQTIFGLTVFPNALVQGTFQALCWGLYGLILGWSLSHSIRNLDKNKAIIAGAMGGIIGGFGFLFTSALLAETLGRMIGVGILGAALALCLILVEEHYRSAYLEVHWARNEVSNFTLGRVPIHIGGGKEEDIFIYGIQPRAMSLWMEHGNVKGTYHVTGENKELHDGSPIKLGKVEMFIRVKSR
jgi:Ca-activated chloride channel family protein